MFYTRTAAAYKAGTPDRKGEFQIQISNGETVAAQNYSAVVALAETRLNELHLEKEWQCAVVVHGSRSDEAKAAWIQLAAFRVANNISTSVIQNGTCMSCGVDVTGVHHCEDTLRQIAEFNAPAPIAPKKPRTKKAKKPACTCPLCTPNPEADGRFYCTAGREHLAFKQGRFICAGDIRTVLFRLQDQREAA